MADMTEKGTWLTVPVREDRTQLLYFRHEFDASSLVCAFRLSADCRYKLFCNGVPVQSGPCKGDDKVWYWDEVSLKECLRSGTNVLAVEVLWTGSDPWNSNHSLFTMGCPALYGENARRACSGRSANIARMQTVCSPTGRAEWKSVSTPRCSVS